MKKHNFLSTAGIKTLQDGTQAPVVITPDNIGTLYNGSISDSIGGDNAEDGVRYCTTGTRSRRHPGGVTDIVIKSGVTLEVKTGAGWVYGPCYNSKAEAEAVLASGQWRMRRASHVAYLPRYNGPEDLANVLILKQSDFIRVFTKAGKIRVKKASCGLWGIAIQQYIPTPTFKASQRKYMEILDGLLRYGEYIDIFCQRMNVKCYDIPGVVEW